MGSQLPDTKFLPSGKKVTQVVLAGILAFPVVKTRTNMPFIHC